VSRPFTASEVLNHLVGTYEVTYEDPKNNVMSLSFWMSKSFGSRSVPMDDVEITAVMNNELKSIRADRLDTCMMGSNAYPQFRLGMRLKHDALPDDWKGKCEIRFSRTIRCFPFSGIADISKHLRTPTVRPEPPVETP